MATALLELEGIRFGYPEGAWALDVPALRVDAGALTGIVGPNGAGKSTLLRLAAGVLAAPAGAVRLGGRPLAAMRRREIARRLGYLPQESPALYDYTVEDVVRMGRYAHGRGAAGWNRGDAEAAARAMEAVSVASLGARLLSHVSGGERRRALLAAVLAQEPELLLLDEPTSGLDVQHAGAIFRVVRRLAAGGLGSVVVTHDINLASLFCDRLLVLRGGRIAADGDPRDVITEATMAAVYGADLLVRRHPATDRPIVMPAAGGALP